MKNSKNINRQDFMQFFRDDEKLHELTPDDRGEVFRTILLGSCDITKKLLEEIISDYSVTSLKVINVKEQTD